MNRFQYDQRQHKINLRKAKRAKNRKAPRTTAKPGVQPVSIMSSDHPARIFGWDSDEARNRDRTAFA